LIGAGQDHVPRQVGVNLARVVGIGGDHELPLPLIRDDQQRDDPQSLLRIDCTLSAAIIEEKSRKNLQKVC
jgi:hypothetical protein